MSEEKLREKIERIAADSKAKKAAVAYYDYETGSEFSHDGEEWFHAASTIKVPVLVGVFGAIDAGDLTADSRVHVRNRFLSVADSTPYRIEAGRDANSHVHAHIGKTMKIVNLARHMIVTSSNLATNLLIDLIG